MSLGCPLQPVNLVNGKDFQSKSIWSYFHFNDPSLSVSLLPICHYGTIAGKEQENVQTTKQFVSSQHKL